MTAAERDIAHKAGILTDALEDVAERVPGARLKGRGMMQGVDVGSGELAEEICARAYQKGLIIETSGPDDQVVKVLAPLTTPEATFRKGLDILRDCAATRRRPRSWRRSKPMIVRDFNEIVEKERDRVVSDAQWSSVRMLLAGDGMGFSFHVTFLDPGSEHTFEYKNHFESVYCMSGTGSITDHATGETHAIRPGVMYALDSTTATPCAPRKSWSWPASSTRP